MKNFASLCALAAACGLSMAPTGAFAAQRMASFQVSLTIECVAQDEVAQCGDSRFLARKDIVDESALPNPIDQAAFSAQSEPAAEQSAGSAAAAPKRRVTVITY